MKVVAFVPIKFNSQRLENKNILPLGKYPLCWYIFETLKQVKHIDKIYVYCSDIRIQKYIPSNIKFLKRPSNLDSHQTIGLQIYTSFAEQIPADAYVLAHATSPFIKPFSIQQGLDAILEKGYDSAFSVQKMQTYTWYHNEPLNYALNNVIRTQELTPVQLETSAFYIFTHSVLMKGQRIGCKSLPIITDRIESVDIDEVDDYELAQAIISNDSLTCHTLNYNLSNHKYDIKLVLLDFDGTMSNGEVYISNDTARYSYNAVSSKAYYTKDGYILRKLTQNGIVVVIVSGNDLDFFQQKADKLGLKLIGNCDNKIESVSELATEYEIDLKTQVVYMGDDDNDIEVMKSVAIAGCPADASKNVRKVCQYISCKNGGKGAVRDFMEYVFPNKC